MRIIKPFLKSLSLAAILISASTLFAQNFQLQLNPQSHNIGDGTAAVVSADSITSAHWSNLQSVDSVAASGLKEGINYTVQVPLQMGASKSKRSPYPRYRVKKR